ncbi:AAA family ATPase [Pseudoduganella sp. R-31]|uniref:AAA family ATPase n=1 Tax=Pseudoduganella sp. R-31 TaxID=3404060 RepID=UPI003CFBA506
MIESIDVQNFGSYNGFVWAQNVVDQRGQVPSFRKLNILYGRNYSGKTTLSRIVQCVERGRLPEKYAEPKFRIKTANEVITEADVANTNLSVRVFNKDFVDLNLSFLRESQGTVQTFAILGEQNAELLALIASVEAELGSVEEKTGFRFEFYTNRQLLEKANREHEQLQTQLDQKLAEKANKPQSGIKHNPLFRDPNYDIRKIRLDIVSVLQTGFVPLDEGAVGATIALLDESPMSDIGKPGAYRAGLREIFSKADELVTRRISPTAPIKALLENGELQSWVKAGIDHHRHHRSDCAFCGNQLPDDLWAKLDAHFSKESQILEDEIRRALQTVEAERLRILRHTNVQVTQFYSSLREDATASLNEMTKARQFYIDQLEAILEALKARAANIFRPSVLSVSLNADEAHAAALAAFEALIDAHNKKTGSIASDQLAARKKLRLLEVSKFVSDIGYQDSMRALEEKKQEVKTLEESQQRLTEVGKNTAKRLEDLRIQLRDERQGAQRVNSYLNHYFGNQTIRLDAIPDADSPNVYRFKILRGDEDAHNLSEGECSLIAFCYFLAKLDEIDTKGKELIIYIDDPISSLDSNHIFFVYGLIHRVLMSPLADAAGNQIRDATGALKYPFKQLFISTHNLEFLKYLRRLPIEKKGERENFMVMRRDRSSVISLMPRHLRTYVTELNFLFGEICVCADPSNIATNYQAFYGFGNSLRKFLEGYLFFKYPSESIDYDKRVHLFFDDGSVVEPIVQRITNEFSHLGEFVDRGSVPIDGAEISSVAKFVLSKLKASDYQQYTHFLDSVGVADPIN